MSPKSVKRRILDVLQPLYRASPPTIRRIERVAWKRVRPVVDGVLAGRRRRRARHRTRPRPSPPPVSAPPPPPEVGERHEPETRKLCESLITAGSTVFDVGAHHGEFTRLFSRLVGPTGLVYAFEPEPDTFIQLERNTAELANVERIGIALSDEAGRASFNVSAQAGAHSLVDDYEVRESIEVEVTTLDAFWDSLGRPRVALMKMDIQGAEPAALRGARRMLEANPGLEVVAELCPGTLASGGMSVEAFLEQLTDLGYTCHAIGEQGVLSTTIPELEGYDFINILCRPASATAP